MSSNAVYPVPPIIPTLIIVLDFLSLLKYLLISLSDWELKEHQGDMLGRPKLCDTGHR